jgi:exosortase O
MDDEDKFRPNWLRPLVAVLLILLVFFYEPHLPEAVAQTQPSWVFSEEIITEPWPLSPGEVEWLSSGGALQGDRWRFRWQDYSGSILFITSDSWRAHHRPERCFQVYGLSVEEAQTYLMQPDFSFRFLMLGAGRDKVAYSAVYWLQSPDQATDDYASRIWADLSPDHETWVLVTVLFDEAYDPLAEDLLALYPVLRQSVAQRLGGENLP